MHRPALQHEAGALGAAENFEEAVMRGDTVEETIEEASRAARDLARRRRQQGAPQEVEDAGQVGMRLLQLREQRRDIDFDPAKIRQRERLGAACCAQFGVHRLRADDVLRPQHADELPVRRLVARIGPRHRPPRAAQRRRLAEHGLGAVGRGRRRGADDQHDVAIEQDRQRAVHRSGFGGGRRLGGRSGQVQARAAAHAVCASGRASRAV